MRTRVLLVDMPRLLSDLVHELIDGDPELEVVGEVTRRENLLEAITAYRPSAVVIGLPESATGPIWDRLFVEHPGLRVMAISPEGRRAGVLREPFPGWLLQWLREPETHGGPDRELLSE